LTEPTRNSQGNFIRTPEQADHDARAAQLRGRGLSYRAIAAELGVSVSSAHQAVARAFRDTLAEPAEQARAVELARLEAAHDVAAAIMGRDHITVSHGRIVEDSDGNPILDDGPALQAVAAVVRASESRRKLLGLDAATKTENINTAVPQDAELQERTHMAKERVAEKERRLPAGDDEA